MKSKIVSRKMAVAIRENLKRRKKVVVFTNGCFDIIHSGHAVYLDRARRLGDFLIVGLNTDKSVRRLKGKNRPIISFRERALLLSYLSPVDLVVGFGDDTPLNLINHLKPDILAKGADYRISEIVGAPEVKSWGGRVVRIPLVKGRSTSQIIKMLNPIDFK
ncbi:MAG: D-glycero-beta-D-manno-heptose 1-phosphate adenylyltransferase [Candidatus Zixiibacteriota bacterium]|nr:MAG: D-glycero-beta-D-manno-heptose 1-phosphate adenylyltransferase [candidate division Zixibacteria bacterium]